jgi:hypothetical protein
VLLVRDVLFRDVGWEGFWRVSVTCVLSGGVVEGRQTLRVLCAVQECYF